MLRTDCCDGACCDGTCCDGADCSSTCPPRRSMFCHGSHRGATFPLTGLPNARRPARRSMVHAVPAMAWTINRRVMGAGRRHVLQISLAGAAAAADRRQALLIGGEAAIGAAVAEEFAVIGAPRIVLRFGAGRDRRGGDNDSERNEQRPHGGPPDASPSPEKPQMPMIISRASPQKRPPPPEQSG